MSRLIKLAREEKYDDLADSWLEDVESGIPPDTIIGVIEVLTDKERYPLAGELIELALGEMKNNAVDDIPTVVKGIAQYFHENEILRRSLVETLRDEYMLFRPLEYFLSESGLVGKNADIASCWRKFLHLVRYSEGNYIYHHIYGAGRIRSVSRIFISVDFPDYPEHDMRLTSIIESDSIPPLNADSLLILRDYNPDELIDLLDNNPADFLRRLLAEPIVKNTTATRRNFAEILGISEKEITKRWKRLKEIASKTENFSVPGDEITTKDEESTLADQVKQIINDKQLKISSKVKRVSSLLKTASSDDWLSLSMLLPNLIDTSSPETGALFELYWLLSKRGTDAEFEKVRGSLLEPTASRAMRALGEIYSISCSKKYIEFFLISDVPGDELLKFFSTLQKSLWIHAANLLLKSNIDVVKACIHLFLSNPADADRYIHSLLFVADHSGENLIGEEQDIVSLLMGNITFAGAEMQKKAMRRLLSKMKDEFNCWLERQDTRKLENLLLELENSTAAQSEGFYLAINRFAAGRKTGLSRGNITETHFWESDWLFSSPGAIEQRKLDILHLKDVEIPEAVEAITVAASHGDLKENAEYHAAIERRDLLLDRMRTWDSELKKYYPYPNDKINNRVAAPGTSVTLKNVDGSIATINLVGPLDADVEEGRINYLAPIGQLLLGKAVGDSVILPGNEASSALVSIEVINFPDKR